MKINAKSMNSPLARSVRSFAPEMRREDFVPCMGTVHMQNVYMTYGSEKEHYRPMLVLTGRVNSVVGDFPYRIDQVNFGNEPLMCPEATFFYRFSDDELAELCKKGLYNDGFAIPDNLVDNMYEMPMMCSYRMLDPVNDRDVPVMFVQIEDQHGMETSEEHCGYRLADYFEKAESVVAAEDTIESMAEEEYASEVEDALFTPEHKTLPVAEPVIPDPNEELLASDDKLREAWDRVNKRVAEAKERDKQRPLPFIYDKPVDDEPQSPERAIDFDYLDYYESDEEPAEEVVPVVEEPVIHPDVDNDDEFEDIVPVEEVEEEPDQAQPRRMPVVPIEAENDGDEYNM